MKKKEKELKKKNTIFNEIKGDPQKRAWVILGGYLLFFVLIVVSIRSTPSNYQKTSTQENYSNYYGLQELKSNNYHFRYEINLDNNKIFYEGDRTNRESLFTRTQNQISEDYYETDEVYFKRQDEQWIQTENPYFISSIKEPSNIEKMVEDAKYISKTDYESGNKSYTYQITTTSLIKLLDKKIVDLDDLVNEFTITIDSNKRITKLEFNFTPYTNYIGMSQLLGNIVLSYSEYGTIGNLDEKK